MRNPAFGEWVQAVIDERYGGTAGKLAKAIDVTLTTLARGQEAGTLGADTLLRLALVAGRNPSEVLRLAGKADWADLIEQCYGPPQVIAQPDVRETARLLVELPDWYVRATRRHAAAFASEIRRSRDASTPPVTSAAKPGTPRSRGAQGRKRRGDATT